MRPTDKGPSRLVFLIGGIALAVLAILGGSMLSGWPNSHSSNSVTHDVGTQADDESQNGGSSPASTMKPESAPTDHPSTLNAPGISVVKPSTFSRKEDSVEAYSKWGAMDSEDAQWLARHGYPTPEEESELASLTEAELRQRASQGDLLAMVELGRRILSQDREDREGLDLMFEAASRGSNRALSARAETLGNMHQDSFTCADPYAAASFLAAAMLGDRGAILGYEMCTRTLDGNRKALVILMASQIMREVQLARLNRLGPAGLFDPRPGDDAIIDIGLGGG